MHDVERLLHDPNLGVRTEALLYLTHLAHIDPLDRIETLGDFADFSLRSAMVAFLARPGRGQNLDAANMMLSAMVHETGPDARRTRLEAARLVETLPDGFDEHLKELLTDFDPEVAKYAIRAVGKLKKRALRRRAARAFTGTGPARCRRPKPSPPSASASSARWATI